MQGFSLPSFAKINWTLHVLGKRKDGFHELFTVFQTVSLCDILHFAESETLELTCENVAIPTDGRNLIVKAARALREKTGARIGASIHLEKRIPSPGGLGGGSSNAVSALVGLMHLWGIALEDRLLNEIASELGSDMAFFLQGGTAIGTGRGEMIEHIDDRDATEMLIVTPDVNVSTRAAFRDLNAPTLTNADLDRILPVCRKDADSFDPHHSVLTNDFERSVFSAYPEIERVKTSLIELGAQNAAMSGSGASVFAVFDKKETRQAAEKALDREITWRKFAVSTISREQYREALGV